VNHTEVVSKLAEKGLPEAAIRSTLDALHLKSINFDSVLSMSAGLLRPLTKSLDFRSAIAPVLPLPDKKNVPALTTDKAWENLDIGIAVTVIR
jgi:PIN domain nuclease of toxin-antitoxin system